MTTTYPLHVIDQFKPIIVAARKQLGLTQADVAMRLGITQQTYARMENNLAGLSLGRVLALCQIVGLEIRFNESRASVRAKSLKTGKQTKPLQSPLAVSKVQLSSRAAFKSPKHSATPSSSAEPTSPSYAASKPLSYAERKRPGKKNIPEW